MANLLFMNHKQGSNFLEISALFTPNFFGARAAERLHPKPPKLDSITLKDKRVPSPSDFDLNPPHLRENSAQRPPIEATVLVPIVRHKELSVLLTKRTEHLPTHAGQISFPGGKNDPRDEGPIGTALREAKEEIGLNEVHVEPIGFLDVYRTVTGYAVTPVVAFLDEGCPMLPNPQEVSELFEVPLAFLMNPKNLEVHSRDFMGWRRNFYAFSFKDYYIWGATAGILKNLHEKIFGP